MAKRLLGIILIISSAIGLLFFREYTGQMIPYPTLFVFLSIAIGLFGAFLFLRSRTKREIAIDSEISRAISDLKSKGEKIVLQYDNCKFKGNDYQEEIQDESRLRSDDVLFNQTSRVKIVEIAQSAIVYCHHSGESKEWFKSQTFPISEVGLKMRVMKGELILYVDRFDRGKYYFELG
jgi:hypothetical protein